VEALAMSTQGNSGPPLDPEQKRQVRKAKAHRLTCEAIRASAIPTLHDISTMAVSVKVPVIPDLLYPGAWLMVGRPKIGKSWLFLQLALAIAYGRRFLGYGCLSASTGVLAFFGEDDDARIQSRLKALDEIPAPANIHVVNQQQLIKLAKQFAEGLSFQEYLNIWLNEHKTFNVRTIIVDTETTIPQIWNAQRIAPEALARVTETDYQQTRSFDELALRRQIVILLGNHTSKRHGRKGDWVDVHEFINRSNTAVAGVSGSIVLADDPDTEPYDTTNRHRVLGVRGRDLRDDVLLSVMQGTDTPYFESLGPYLEVRQTETEKEILTALERIMPTVEDGKYVTAEELAQEIDRKPGTIQRAISRMVQRHHVTWKDYCIVTRSGKKGGIRLIPTAANDGEAHDQAPVS
jgi:hypothetical protein